MDELQAQPSAFTQGVMEELRQRKVLRIAGIYLLMAVPILEVADLVMPRFGWPDWVLTALMVLLAVGFPLALVLAWMFDITADGVKTAAEVQRMPKKGPSKGRLVDFAIIAALLVVLGYFVWDKYLHETPPAVASGGVPSIAVLPFVNMSSDAQNEYFSDGVAEELLNALAKIPGLRVAARTSSFYFKGKNVDLRDVGRSLGVENVLEGSVRKEGDAVRVTAQLISVQNGFHLWSEVYDYKLDDVFAVQDQISRAVVKALQVQLLGDQSRALRLAPTANADAHTLYLRGRYELHRRTEDSIARSTQLFDEASKADPDYAAAWVGLAESYILQFVNHRSMPRDEALGAANEALARALALDENLAEAHAALGLLRMQEEQLDAAETAYERALKLNPGYSEAWHWYGLLDGTRGDREGAHDKLRRAVELDPLHRVARSNLGQAILALGDWEEARAFFERGAELEPEYSANYLMLAGIDSRRPWCEPDKALGHVEQALAFNPTDIGALAMKMSIEMQLGDLASARATTQAMLAARPDHHKTLDAQLALELHGGDREASARLLDDAVAQHSEALGDEALRYTAVAHLLRDDFQAAVAAWEVAMPQLKESPPQLGKKNYQLVPMVAYTMREAGAGERVEPMLAALEGKIARLPRFGMPGYELLDVDIAALRGDRETALARLEDAVAAGYRNRLVLSVWTIDKYPIYEALWEEPRFKAVADTLAAYYLNPTDSG